MAKEDKADGFEPWIMGGFLNILDRDISTKGYPDSGMSNEDALLFLLKGDNLSPETVQFFNGLVDQSPESNDERAHFILFGENSTEVRDVELEPEPECNFDWSFTFDF
ncbi:MAG: hypothetical protein COA94_02620 [Rickettsiales bacterium]|nr:MAG: hypothetical protein COA94_02620 [Rickettsiales bacterium]